MSDDMHPWMSLKDRRIILDILTLTSKRHLECLEWGAGGSTIYYPRMLEASGRTFNWQSIEHDPKWCTLVGTHAPKSVSIQLFPETRPHDMPMKEYVQFPLMLNRRFDFIFVDGRKRRRCLEVASKLTAAGGVVVLHDASRHYYQCSFKFFTSWEFVGDDLWIGRIDVAAS